MVPNPLKIQEKIQKIFQIFIAPGTTIEKKNTGSIWYQIRGLPVDFLILKFVIFQKSPIIYIPDRF